MSTGGHQDSQKTFEELTFAEQAKSITAMTNNLKAAVKAHVRKSKTEKRDAPTILKERIAQITRMRDSL